MWARNSTLYIHEPSCGHFPGIQQWKSDLESCGGDDKIRERVLTEMIVWMSQGESELVSKLIMQVIRFILPSEDHRIKKLLHLFWENAVCLDSNGELREEMILVCNALRNDLQSPNEYIRGATCRMLCSMPHLKVLEPLLDAIRDNLHHRFHYVRRNAVMCCYSLVRNFGVELLPGILDEVESILVEETDPSTQRNCFLLLVEYDQEKALKYAQEMQSSLGDLGELFQIQYLNLLKSYRGGNALKLILHLMEVAASPSVRYEAASTILEMSSDPSAVKTAYKTLLSLVISQGDINARQVILEQLKTVVKMNPKLCEENLIDLMRILKTVSKSAMQSLGPIISKMINSEIATQIVPYLRRELLSFNSASAADEAYVQTILGLLTAVYKKDMSLVTGDISTLCNIMCRLTTRCQKAITSILKYVASCNQDNDIITKHVLSNMLSVKDTSLMRDLLWTLSVHIVKDKGPEIVERVKTMLQPYPLEDHSKSKQEPTTIREHVMCMSDTLLLASICSTVSCAASTVPENTATTNDALQVVSNIYLRMIRNTLLGKNSPSLVKVRYHLRVLMALVHGDTDKADALQSLNESNKSPVAPMEIAMLEMDDSQTIESPKKNDVIRFRLLSGSKMETVVPEVDDLTLALYGPKHEDGNDTFAERLAKVQQMTGLGDPVYVEGFFKTEQFDILAEFLIINRTAETLQNITLNISSGCSICFTAPPQPITLPPHGQGCVFGSMRASCTDSGQLFGYVSFDLKSSTDKKVLAIRDVRVDTLKGVRGGRINPTRFRELWLKSEWENKIDVDDTRPNMKPLEEYVSELSEQSHMSPVFPLEAVQLPGAVSFINANLYGRSGFGEEVLANLSLYKTGDSNIKGHLRVRAREQGIALTVGDRLGAMQAS